MFQLIFLSFKHTKIFNDRNISLFVFCFTLYFASFQFLTNFLLLFICEGHRKPFSVISLVIPVLLRRLLFFQFHLFQAFSCSYTEVNSVELPSALVLKFDTHSLSIICGAAKLLELKQTNNGCQKVDGGRWIKTENYIYTHTYAKGSYKFPSLSRLLT